MRAAPDGPEIEALRRIEQARVDGATELSLAGLDIGRIPDEIAQLPGLTYCDLRQCGKLQDVRALARLPALQSLNLSGCEQLQDIRPLSRLHGLQRLVLRRCKSLQDLRPLSQLHALEKVNLSACPGLRDLRPLSGLSALKNLQLYWCTQLSVVALADLPALQELNLYGCTQLTSMALTQLPSLLNLVLASCNQLEDLRPLSQLPSLKRLDLRMCEKLRDVSPLAALSELKTLYLSECPGLADVGPLSALKALKRLHLRKCRRVASVQFADMPVLRVLSLRRCRSLQSVELSNLPALQTVNLTKCRNLRSLGPFGKLPALQKLSLDHCWRLEDIQALSTLTTLRSLSLHECRVQNLQALSGLLALENLDLSWCGKQQDLSSLAELRALQVLGLRGHRGLRDLRPLARLQALRELDIAACSRLTDLSPLSTLLSLQRLDLAHCRSLRDLRPLAPLQALQNLSLHRCHHLRDLQPLLELNALQELNLDDCARLQRVRLSSALPALKELEMSRCIRLESIEFARLAALEKINMSDCSGLRAVEISDLPALQRLRISGAGQLPDMSLVDLPALHELNLADCKQLSTIAFTDLPSLEWLSLNGCQQFQDMSALARLSALATFTMFDGFVLDCSLGAQPLASWRKLENLYANRLSAAPPELASSNVHENALPQIRAWQQDLAAGEAPNSTVKLCVLGNGYVGKTQLCRRLDDLPFDSGVSSTHGISRGDILLAESRGDMPAITANFWDFGGQDVYLGTHALFLDARAIYIIAWHPKYENTDEFEQDGVLMRNRPLTYWLEYVQSLAGPLAPIVVVQTQCESELDVQPAPLPARHDFKRLNSIASSALMPDGIERLRLELKSAARYQLERYGKVRLPLSWVAIGAELRARMSEKTLPRKEFDAVCSASNAAAVPGVVLEYLHRSGQVFWREGVFGDQVVIDQTWALSGIYAVLERSTRVLPLIKDRGGFVTREFLAAVVWREHSEQEQQLFLSIMQRCQICFRVAQGLFIVPALLPALSATEEAVSRVWRDAEPDVLVRMEYAFLHEGVLRAMLCGIGATAGRYAIYWAYGICFYDSHFKSTVRITSRIPDGEISGGWMKIEASGPHAGALAKYLVDSIARVNIGRAPQIVWELGQEDDDEKERYKDKLPFENVAPGPTPKQAPCFYVSYAWEPESRALIEAFKQRLPKSMVMVLDEDKLRAGDWIRRFVLELGRARLVVVVLSEQYLRSIHCMRELLYLFNSSLGERDAVMARIVPLIVGKISVGRAADRSTYVSYWKDEHDRTEKALKSRDLSSIGDADRDELLLMKDFQHRVSDLLAWVGDTLMPHGKDLHTKGIDAAIELLQKRMRE